jgi:hypothetical protein
MTHDKKDFEPEVLGPALQERMEKSKEYIEPPLAMQAKLFGTVAREVIERFGEEGRAAILEAVRRFGEERGRRMARRCASEGRKADFAAFLVISDLDTSYHEMTPVLGREGLILNISSCPFATASREWGLEGYGKLFCHAIDSSIMKGFNPEGYEAVCEQNLTEGADTCVIRYGYKRESRG